MSVATTSRFDEVRLRHQAAALDALPAHIERLGWSAARLQEHQRDQLRAVLGHAVERSPFYARRLAGIDVGALEPHDLSSLPITTKSEVMASFDEVVTDRRVRRARVDAHLAKTGDVPVYLDDELLCLASGGSSGLRGTFVYGWDATVDFLLGLARGPLGRLSSLGGALPPGGVPMAMVAAGSGVHATRALSAIFSGGLLDVAPVPVTAPLHDIVARLNEVQPLLLQGYPSVLVRLAEEQLAGRLAISVLSVTSTSEQLLPEVRRRISTAFGVEVADQFGSSEGVLGVSAPGEEAITLASDLAIVELVDDAGRPVRPGEVADRALITTLFNPTMPLVRYELTDRMVAQPPDHSHGHLRVLVEGRVDPELRWGSTTVHPLALRTVLVHAGEVAEYQVRQTPAGVDVDVVGSGQIDCADLAQRLQDSLAAAGLVDPVVRVAEVDRLRRHPETGKLARFVPLRGA